MLNLNEFLNKCKESPVDLTLQKSTNLGNGAYKILCSCSALSYKDTEIKKAIKNLYGTKVSVVNSTIKRKPNNLVSMIVKANVRTKAYNEDALPSNMKKVTANILADINDGTIWEVKSFGDKKRLVMKEEEDFDKIFEHNNRICTAAIMDQGLDLQNGDYVAFYSPTLNQVLSGYLLIAEDDSMVVIDEELNEHPVIEEEILEATDLTELDRNPVVLLETTDIESIEDPTIKEKIEASLTSNESKTVLDYMRILYKDTEFYKKLAELVGARVSLGEDGKYESTMVEASFLEGDYSDIKDKIKDYLIHQAVEDLEAELEESSEIEDEEVIEEEANAEGDIDFATEEEMVEESDVNDIDERPFIQKEDAYQLSGETEEEIDVDPETEKSSGLLDAEDIDVVTEAELDDGEFEDVEIDDMSDEELINQLKNALENKEI